MNCSNLTHPLRNEMNGFLFTDGASTTIIIWIAAIMICSFTTLKKAVYCCLCSVSVFFKLWINDKSSILAPGKQKKISFETFQST